MFAKCSKCNFVRIKTMRKRCPHCRGTLTRPSIQELNEIGEQAMERSRAARCMIDSCTSERQRQKMILVAHMSIFHGQNITEYQAEEMLGIARAI